MTLTVSLIWMVGMAIVTIAILTIGTLAAADLLPRAGSRSAGVPPGPGRGEAA